MITRRDFLKHGSMLAGLGFAAPNLLVRTALAADQPALPGNFDDHVLVLIQMAGGNDSLNTVIPWADPLYRQVRRRLAVPEGDLAKLSDEIALHPSLEPWAKLFEQQRLAVLQGVGYPEPNRSHFVATDIWQTGSPDDPKGTGWISRYNDAALADRERLFKAIAIGNRLPGALKGGRVPTPAINSIDDFRFFPQEPGNQRQDDLATFEALHNVESRQVQRAEFLQTELLNAYTSSEDLRRVVGDYRTSVPYPNTGLGQQLRLIGQMIASPLRVKTFHASIGGFDTHANQGPNHARILGDLARAVTAFQQDLEEMDRADRVLILTYSEFGRRVQENGSAGTDHGAAGAMFAIGEPVKGGILGAHPGLEPEQLDRGDLQWHTDFRQVYATVLERWLGCPASDVLGQSYQPLAFLG